MHPLFSDNTKDDEDCLYNNSDKEHLSLRLEDTGIQEEEIQGLEDDAVINSNSDVGQVSI
jgi:hypothetical protein